MKHVLNAAQSSANALGHGIPGKLGAASLHSKRTMKLEASPTGAKCGA